MGRTRLSPQRLSETKRTNIGRIIIFCEGKTEKYLILAALRPAKTFLFLNSFCNPKPAIVPKYQPENSGANQITNCSIYRLLSFKLLIISSCESSNALSSTSIQV